MRRILLALAFLAVPTLLAAQQQEQVDLQEADPAVQLQESVSSATAPEAFEADAPSPRLPAVETRAVDDQPAQEGGPSTREWWWLVGAIVAGGIVLALLL